MNNKGFTLIEILAAIVILAILTIASIVGYTKYIDYSRKKAYDTMARSAAEAASEYNMDYVGIDSVTLNELYQEQYLEYPADPLNNSRMCTGKVDITHISNYDGLDTEEYDVTICCANFSYIYHFPGGSKELTTCE